jgi:hypothetical protein
MYLRTDSRDGRVTVSTAMVGSVVTPRLKKALAASASARTNVLKVFSTAALADESVVTMLISPVWTRHRQLW